MGRFWILMLTATLNAQGPYRAEKKTIDQQEVYSLSDNARAIEALVAPVLGLNSYSMTVHGKPVFYFPYSSPAEPLVKPGMFGNPLLWPWANRIDGMTYAFGGRRYALDAELGNVRPGANNTPIHGLLLRERRWQIVSFGADARAAWVRAKLDFYRHPELMAQFPFAHTIEVEYRLEGGALAVTTTIENLGAETMPVMLGYHPYFRINDAPRDEWMVRLPVKEKFALSPRLIPTGEVLPNPYSDPLKLEGVTLDDVFGGLARDADGWARFQVRGKSESITVEYGPRFTVAVVYAPKGRDFICFEPMTGITNAFNAAAAGWYKDLQTAEAGAKWQETFRIRPEGFTK